MLDVLRESQPTEQSPTHRQEVPDAAGDQDPYEVIVKRPARVVARRHGQVDETHGFVDDRDHEGHRLPVPVTCDCDRRFRPCQQRAEARHPSLPFRLRLRLRVAVVAQQTQGVIGGAPRVGHLLAADARCRRSSEVGPECLAATAAHIVRVLLREDEDPPTETIPRDPEQPLVEVRLECMPRPRADRTTYSRLIARIRPSNATTRQGRATAAATMRGCEAPALSGST